MTTDQAFSLELEVPNAETRSAMKEAEKIIAGRCARFSNTEADLAVGALHTNAVTEG